MTVAAPASIANAARRHSPLAKPSSNGLSSQPAPANEAPFEIATRLGDGHTLGVIEDLQWREEAEARRLKLIEEHGKKTKAKGAELKLEFEASNHARYKVSIGDNRNGAWTVEPIAK